MALQTLFRRATGVRSGRLLLLAYEPAGRASSSALGHSGSPQAFVDLDELSWQLQQIAARFEPITLSRVARHVGGKCPLTGPQICVSLHTDDADRVRGAVSVMQRLRMNGTLFVAFERILDSAASGPSDAESRLSWADLRAFAAAGMEIAHRLRADFGWSRLPVNERRQRLTELYRRAGQETGTRIESFAIDAGQEEEPDTSIIWDAAFAGFNLGVVGHSRLDRLYPIDPLMLGRHSITPDVPRATFLSLLDNLEGR